MPTIKERLAAMQEGWDAGKKKAAGIPDGKYKFQLQNAEVVEVKDTQMLQVHWESLILEGEYAGECKHDWNRHDADWGTVYLMERIEQLGFEVPSRSEDLEETISTIAEAAPTFAGTLKTTKNDKGTFQNLKVNRLLDSGTPPSRREATPPPPSPPADDDDLGDWKIDDRIIVEIDGIEEKGKITKLNVDDASIEYDDGSTGEAPYDDLMLDEPDAPESEDGGEGWAVNDRCVIEIEGEGNCAGVIENIDGDTYSVKFDDDTEGDFELADLEPEEAEEESPTLEELTAIATSIQDFDVTDADTRASLIEKLIGEKWDRTLFLPDEVETLEKVGVEFMAAKKKATKKKPAKKKAAKKATKKNAAKKKTSPKKKATKKKKR